MNVDKTKYVNVVGNKFIICWNELETNSVLKSDVITVLKKFGKIYSLEYTYIAKVFLCHIT